jgi:DNA-directed RNA polymerase specialized sigma24 family protein
VPNSQAVLQHLPFLRRYARALTGSQVSGDAYVAATLESLIASPDMLAQTANSRVGLYRLFTKIWGSLAVNGKPEAGEVVLPPEQHITQITPRPRQAFLLVALEGFSEEDAAQILDCDLATLRNLVEESGRELAAEIATDVLIIEDETFIAMDIEALVESLGHNVIGRARQEEAAGPHPGRHPAGRRQFGSRCRQRASRHVRSAGDLHHRLSGAFPDRATAGAGVPDRQAVPACRGLGGGEPGPVLRPQGASSRAAAGRTPADGVTPTINPLLHGRA